MNTPVRPASAPGPVIDPTAIADFAEVVFGYLEGLVPIRLFAETGTPDQKPRIEFCTPELLADTLVRLAPSAAAHQRGLYVVPGTVTRKGSARAEDILQTGVLLVDIDAGDIGRIRDHLAAHLGAPSLEIASGGRTAAGEPKRHLYWRLTEAAKGGDLGRVRALRQIVAGKAETDASFGSLHQPIRVPGSLHGKHGDLSPVRLLVRNHLEYELDDLIAAAEAMPPLAGTVGPSRAPVRAAGATAGDLMLMPIRAGGIDGTTRFGALSKVIGHWIAMARLGRCTPEEAWIRVAEHNAAMIAPPWDETRLRREFDALARLDAENHGAVPSTAIVPAGASSDASLAPACSDDALAAAFVSAHADFWRHVGLWGAWLSWSGTHWQRDETGLVREHMRLICRAAAMRAKTPGEARRIASDKTIAAALRIAAADPAIATRVADWDSEVMLLNTPAGVIDLETGETHAHAPDRLITQITAASPGGACPRWLAFLGEITAGDGELQAYLQRLAGYCLTGSTREQVFVFLHGDGANGKSVFVQALTSVLGDHAATATLSTFMATKTDRHLTELAGLRAARLVIVPETEAGQAWAEARIKTVTGGDRLRANFMHRDHFEFTPHFKLVVVGNHRPALTSFGEAMRRRLHLVPFTVTIPPERRDRDLMARLTAERDGILAWALEGCGEWQKTGLAPPAAVRNAGMEYFAAEDMLGQWIDECCATGPVARATARALYASWAAWAEATGQPQGSQKSLGEALRERGFVPGKVGTGRGWHGIGLRPAPMPGREPA